jgi:hypothetical protein
MINKCQSINAVLYGSFGKVTLCKTNPKPSAARYMAHIYRVGEDGYRFFAVLMMDLWGL